MTKRLEEIHIYVDRLMADKNFSDKYLEEKSHLLGVSSCCVLLALRRGLDPELAAISGMLHDIYRLKTGINMNHGHNGAEMARVVLNRAESSFLDSEKKIILSAIFHHGDKLDVHDEYDELLKDADTLAPILYSGGSRQSQSVLRHWGRAQRLEKMAKELGLSIDGIYPEECSERIKEKCVNNAGPIPSAYANECTIPTTPVNKRLLLADIAEKLAASHIEGTRKNAAYMNLVRYWPEDTAWHELINGWCAAFVYHSCQEAGLTLPIKWLTEGTRFAGVAAWSTWARRLGYFIKDEPGIIPQRGDIVLYRNIIPPENKPEEHRQISIDHIGIVLGCDSDSDSFTAAEGNVNNQNVSGIMTRPLHQNVEGYIRIDNAFLYDNWVFNYKSGTEQNQ